MAELSPSQYASLRDSVCESVAKDIAATLASITTEQNHLIEAIVEQRMTGLVGLVMALQKQVDEIAGRFDKIERADKYAVTRRALVKLLEQTDAD